MAQIFAGADRRQGRVLGQRPFAEAMGRDLGGYVRDFRCQGSVCDPNTYHDPADNPGLRNLIRCLALYPQLGAEFVIGKNYFRCFWIEG